MPRCPTIPLGEHFLPHSSLKTSQKLNGSLASQGAHVYLQFLAESDAFQKAHKVLREPLNNSISGNPTKYKSMIYVVLLSLFSSCSELP
jgi:hypothetical protein